MAILSAFILPHPPIILPEIGRGEEMKIEKTAAAYREAARRIAALAPDTIVLTSPHSVMYADYFHISPGMRACGDFEKFGIPDVSMEVNYDEEFAYTLADIAQSDNIPAGTLGEKSPDLDHGTMVPLRFVEKQYNSFRLVRIGLSGLPPLTHYRFGKSIAKTAGVLGRRVVLIASGDLSHKLTAKGPYGFAPEGPEFDREVTHAMAEGDFLRFLTFSEAFCDAAAECGLRSFQIMAGALDGRTVHSELLSYEGPFGVGYGAAAFTPGEEDGSRRFDVIYERQEGERLAKTKTAEDEYVRLARFSLETYIRTGKRAKLPKGLSAELLNHRAGTFVSLKKDGRLRGCIGTIAPVTGCVAEEILQNSISAAAKDPRFSPVRPDELDGLTYSVDVLGETEAVASAKDLDVKRYGVIVLHGHKRGLLLPNLEGVDTVEQQIDIARQKAGIRPEEDCTLKRFEVVRHL